MSALSDGAVPVTTLELGVGEAEPVGIDVAGLDPDVALRNLELGQTTKIIAYLGMTELTKIRQTWRVGLRLGGSHIVIGSHNDSMEGLYDRAIRAKTGHPTFHDGLEEDVRETLATEGVNPLDERGIMDFVWIMSPPLNSPSANYTIYDNFARQNRNDGARDYTKRLLSLVISL